MRRVVITGYGVISSIGLNTEEAAASLRNGTSGIEFVPEMSSVYYPHETSPQNCQDSCQIGQVID